LCVYWEPEKKRMWKRTALKTEEDAKLVLLKKVKGPGIFCGKKNSPGPDGARLKGGEKAAGGGKCPLRRKMLDKEEGGGGGNIILPVIARGGEKGTSYAFTNGHHGSKRQRRL